VLDARAARQPALLAAQQDPRTSLLIEAFLYEEQTRRGIRSKHFDEFNDVADHCTVCHKCVKPCPVDIDFGDVSIAMRNFLRKQGKKSFSPGTAAAMAFLTSRTRRRSS
jgi:Fe-S oxidoreductase